MRSLQPHPTNPIQSNPNPSHPIHFGLKRFRQRWRCVLDHRFCMWSRSARFPSPPARARGVMTWQHARDLALKIPRLSSDPRYQRTVDNCLYFPGTYRSAGGPYQDFIVPSLSHQHLQSKCWQRVLFSLSVSGCAVCRDREL